MTSPEPALEISDRLEEVELPEPRLGRCSQTSPTKVRRCPGCQEVVDEDASQRRRRRLRWWLTWCLRRGQRTFRLTGQWRHGLLRRVADLCVAPADLVV